jgi:predicted short-subunit dehydrogenase-like oxidoreductase (DUF2520 family)
LFSLKSKIAVIGAGRVSYSLVNALIKSGLNVALIVSRSVTSAKTLAGRLKIKNFSSDLYSLTADLKIFFISVPDNQISLVAKGISKLNLDFENSIFIHLSGAQNISVLNALKRQGAYTASFHIMQTFPGKKIFNLKNSYVAIETKHRKVESFLFSLAKKLNLHPFKISSHNKIYYHLAGVYSSNFLVANQYYTKKLFDRTNSGVNYKKVFHPISEMTLKNIKEKDVQNAISGPVARGDIITVKKHLNALKNDKTLRSNYILQSLTLLELLKKRGKKLSTSHKELKNYLLKFL